MQKYWQVCVGLGLLLGGVPPVYGQDCGTEALEMAIADLEQPTLPPAAEAVLVACGEEAVEPLVRVLNGGHGGAQGNAARVLGLLGAEGAAAVEPLVATVLTAEEEVLVRRRAIEALASIAQGVADGTGEIRGWQTGAVAEVVELKDELQRLVQPQPGDLKIPQREQFGPALKQLGSAQRAVATAAGNLEEDPVYQIVSWIQGNAWVWGLVIYGGGYGLIFWWRPLGLLGLAEFQESVLAAIPESVPLLRPGLTAVLGVVLPGKYAPRVLDAWVEEQLQAKAGQQSPVERRFQNIETVKDRKNRVWLPVKLNGEKKTDARDFTPEALSPLFADTTVGVWIEGEGGSGKTSLAFEIAQWGLAGKLTKHRMLPVLIEDEPGEENLLTLIRKQLGMLIGEKETLDDGLVRSLLREKRVLVILDHVSEMKEESQRKLEARTEDVQINALMVTARYVPNTLNSLWKFCKVKLNPTLLRGAVLLQFVEDYLRKQGAENLLVKGEDYEVCSGLTRMAEERNITALLATLYVDQLLQWENGQGGDLPESTPVLMLSYINKLNEVIDEKDRQKNWTVQRDLKAIAWCCVQTSFYPAKTSRDRVVEVLENMEAEKTAEDRLNYLVQRLNLVHESGGGQSLRIALDPVAEYLVGLYLIDVHGDQQEQWDNLFAEIEETVQPGDGNADQAIDDNRGTQFQAVQGLLLAIRDCCKDKERSKPIPDGLVKQLEDRAGLDQEKLRAEQQRYRLKRLMEDLSVPEAADRLRAAQELGKMGPQAKRATPRLGKVLQDASDVWPVRVEAAKALRQIGSEFPLVVVEWHGGAPQFQLLDQPTPHRVTLPEGVVLDLVKIPGGEFWMGSDESDRASPRHLVKVPEFYMGKYPVTQAQWRAVAALPPEELTLDPNPSHSQGDDRPVETVSWREAREFCLRLSAYVGATYDLPTEAEWEYACRGGTETAYHFGDEITTDLANCGGPNAPQETTPVGHYGIGNRWELYDLHGNVWEWCLDPWHGSHGDKPAALQEDGSRPWLDEEIDISLHSDKSRLLRGGSWNLSPRTCRSAYRNYDVPGVRDYSYGFRVVCRGPRTP